MGAVGVASAVRVEGAGRSLDVGVASSSRAGRGRGLAATENQVGIDKLCPGTPREAPGDQTSGLLDVGEPGGSSAGPSSESPARRSGIGPMPPGRRLGEGRGARRRGGGGVPGLGLQANPTGICGPDPLTRRGKTRPGAFGGPEGLAIPAPGAPQHPGRDACAVGHVLPHPFFSPPPRAGGGGAEPPRSAPSCTHAPLPGVGSRSEVGSTDARPGSTLSGAHSASPTPDLAIALFGGAEGRRRAPELALLVVVPHCPQGSGPALSRSPAWLDGNDILFPLRPQQPWLRRTRPGASHRGSLVPLSWTHQCCGKSTWRVSAPGRSISPASG